MYLYSSFTLAQSYYAPYVLRVAEAFQSGDFSKAEQMQNHLNQLRSLIVQGKDLMKMFGMYIHPPRYTIVRPFRYYCYDYHYDYQ